MPTNLLSRMGALFTCLILLAGCGTRVGPRTAGGTYLNLNGEAVNAYADSMDDTVEASLRVLESIRIPIRFMHSAGGRAVVSATTPDGSLLRLQFVEEGRRLTTVRIRTGAVGFWRQEFSFHLHVLIDERLRRSDLVGRDATPDEQAIVVREEASPETSDSVRLPPDGSHRTNPGVRGTAETAVPDIPSAAAGRLQSTRAVPLPAPETTVPPLSEEPEARVYFETDSNFPKTGELAKIDRIASLLMANPSWTLSLDGFAEAHENGGRPRIVAESRMLAVRYYLVGKGVEDGRLRIGGTNPKEEEIGPGVQSHRRVDLWLRRLP